jgi:cellulose synthase/poly-beta-1,6-N-acetylglucosamine synthase-like glycosyltransferase
MKVSLGHPWDIVVLAVEYFLFFYFLCVNGYYLLTGTMSLLRLPWFVKLHLADPVRRTNSTLDQPVSIIVPAYNERELIVESVKSLLSMDYVNFEVVVVNDGSTDDTIAVLHEAFKLEPYEGIYHVDLPTKPVLDVYQSQEYPELRVIDKRNGGKGDSLNAGINLARFPLIFCTDADSHYHRQTLQWMTEPYQKDRRTVAVGGTIAVGIPAKDEKGRPVFELPKTMIKRFQVLEYLRAFLGTRMGFGAMNGLGIVSGACGLWKRDVIISCGGFRADTIWEDLEMTMKVHNYCISKGRPYRVAFTPYPVCWTDVPPTIGALYKQRRGWHRHLSECITIHRKLLFGHGGFFSWVTMPYFVFFEWAAPIVVLIGTLFTIVGGFLGFVDWRAQWWLLGLVLALSLLSSFISILLDEISFTSYKSGHMGTLLLASFLENLGYRQLVMIANFMGIFAWVFRRPRRHNDVDYPGMFVDAWVPAATK